MLSDVRVERYSRQIVVPEVGGRGQESLLSASVAVCGSGDCAHWAALYLVAAGVGRLTLAGGDASGLAGANPDSRVSAITLPADAAASIELVRAHEKVVAAGVGNEVALRLDAAARSVPATLLWGEARGAVGRVAVLARQAGEADVPCLACVPPAPAAGESSRAPMAQLAARLVGVLLAEEVLESILGLAADRESRLLAYDSSRASFETRRLRRDLRCPVCAAAG